MERRFTEEQVSEIIRRAADISGGEGDPSPHRGQGVTEPELRRIAKEIGLSETAIEVAMRETGTVNKSDTGGDLTYERTFERRIQGEVGDEGYATLIEHFVPEWDPFRGTTRIGTLMSYKCSVGTNTCNVSIAQKAGQTTLKVTSNAWVSMMATFLPATLLSILAIILVSATVDSRFLDKMELLVPILAVVWTAAILGNIKLVKFSNKKVARLVDSAAADLAASADHLRSRIAASAPHVEAELERERLC